MGESVQIDFDPTFIEEAVFLSMKTKQEDKPYRDFCNKKEEIYQKDVSRDDRDEAFNLFYDGYFHNLGLCDFFKNICKDFSHLSEPEIRIVIKRVWCRKHEDVELYVQPGQKTVYLGILARRITDLTFLETFLRHELMRISDMLSPDFQYSPHRVLGGMNEIENNLIRERFCLLWDYYIDSRLKKRGHQVFKSFEKQKEEFENKFFFLAMPESKQILEKLEGCENLLQIDLLSWADDPRGKKILGEGGLRCPLCNFTSFNSVKKWDAETAHIIKEIRKDYPQWEPSKGICPQCFDLYR